MPLFSIIIPVYNVAPYLHDCLDSVFTQDKDVDYEVIIVDDGSSDGSGEICDEYATRYSSRTKLIHQSNQGVSCARNRALNVAEGKYIWFVDADDWISANSLSYLAQVLLKSGADTLFFGATNTTGEDLSDSIFKFEHKDTFLTNYLCFCNPFIIFDRKIVERDLLRFSEGMKMGEDLEFQYRYLINCVNIVSIPYNFYNIREREGSISRSAKGLESNYHDTYKLLNNFACLLAAYQPTIHGWMIPRLSERLKAFLQSAKSLKKSARKDLQTKFNKLTDDFCKLGYSEIMSLSMTLARMDYRIYWMLFTLRKKL